MAEDLGNITIRFGDGPGGGGAGGTQDLAMAREAAKSAMAGIMSNLPAFARVVQAGAQGASFGSLVGATRTAVSGAGGGVGAMALGGAALGAGALLAAVVSIRSIVGRVMDRVSELAAVNAVMAREEAQNRLAQLQRDMKEASVLGPLYSQVSGIWRSLQDQFQPIGLAIKALIVGGIIPVLKLMSPILKFIGDLIKAVIQGIQQILYVLAEMFREAGFAFNTLAQVFPNFKTELEAVANAYFAAQGFARRVANQLGTVVNILQQQQQQNNNPNAVFEDTLLALSSPSLATYRSRVRQGPVRGPSRPQSPTP